jgi:phosphotransferase system  glucose/maltose/N-acetylglucosamine-specific IIC component
MLLAHCIGSVFAGSLFGILSVFGWRAFRGAPLVVLVALFAPMLVAIPFRSSIRNFFKDTDATRPPKARELPFPQ